MSKKVCFMGNCKKLNDNADPCEDDEAQSGKWGKCHEFEPEELKQLPRFAPIRTENPRKKVVTVRFSDREKETLDKFINEYQTSQTDFVRNAVFFFIKELKQHQVQEDYFASISKQEIPEGFWDDPTDNELIKKFEGE